MRAPADHARRILLGMDGSETRPALLAALVVALVLVGAAGGGTTGERLWLGSGTALVVHGAGFRKAEPIRLTITKTTGPVVRRITANRNGGFSARFAIPSDPCVVRRITAVGARGSGAVLRLPLPACPAP